MKNFDLNRFINKAYFKYPEIKEFVKDSERIKWIERPAVFAIVDNKTNMIYTGSTYNLSKTIFFHVKKKCATKTSQSVIEKKPLKKDRYRIIKQARHLSLYIFERCNYTCGLSYMKSREELHFKKIPKNQKQLLSDTHPLWLLLDENE